MKNHCFYFGLVFAITTIICFIVAIAKYSYPHLWLAIGFSFFTLDLMHQWRVDVKEDDEYRKGLKK